LAGRGKGNGEGRGEFCRDIKQIPSDILQGIFSFARFRSVYEGDKKYRGKSMCKAK